MKLKKKSKYKDILKESLNQKTNRKQENIIKKENRLNVIKTCQKTTIVQEFLHTLVKWIVKKVITTINISSHQSSLKHIESEKKILSQNILKKK